MSMSGFICFENAVYEINGPDSCILCAIKGDFNHFKVPSTIFSEEGIRYRIIGIYGKMNEIPIKIMSFDESSEITDVDISLIKQIELVFNLPPRIKRINGRVYLKRRNNPKIIADKSDQRFVSTAGCYEVMNNFPFELAYKKAFSHRLFIRETTRFIGAMALFSNSSIGSVIFPSSVEYIGDYSFKNCDRLRFIDFKKNSKLKKFGKSSFSTTSIESIVFPPNVEEIGECPFFRCIHLRSIAFQDRSKIRIIGKDAFADCFKLDI